MTDMIRQNRNLKQAVSNISVEVPTASITLRRTATVALTVNTAYAVSWQTQVRGNGITWDIATPTTITIDTPGYYAAHFSWSITSANHTCQSEFRISGARPFGNQTASGIFVASATAYLFYHSAVMYLNAGNTIVVILTDITANTTLNALAENAQGASPILHVVQLQGATAPF
jgi:hypothetical protein